MTLEIAAKLPWIALIPAIIYALYFIFYACCSCFCCPEEDEEERENVTPKQIIPLIVIDSGINYFNHINTKDFMVQCMIPNLVLNALIFTSQVKILC